MQKLKTGHVVRISSKAAAREWGLALYTLGKITWMADRSDLIQVDVCDKKVIVKSNHVERVKTRR